MNFKSLLHNVKISWRHRSSSLDALARLLYQYAHRLPKFACPTEWEIGFHYPEPIGFIRLALRPNSGADNFIQGEVFEHNYYKLDLHRPPQTILDLGANIGLTAVYLNRCFPMATLACVEPMPDNIRLLKKNLGLNGADATVFAAAVDATDGKLSMEFMPKDYGHRVATGVLASGHRAIEVLAFSIPTLLDRLGWERVGLLKIDIEGHEKALLSGKADWLNLVDAICIECHDDFFGPDELFDLAKTYEFLAPKRLPGIWLMTREIIAPGCNKLV